MKAFANSGAVLPSSDGVSGKGLVRRMTGKPQHRFADAPALLGIQEQTRPHKKTVDKAAASTMPGREQGALDAPKRGDRSMPDNSPAVADIGLASQPAGPPVKPKRNVVKTDSTPAPSSKDTGQERAPSLGTVGCAPHTTLIGPVGQEPQTGRAGAGDPSWRAVHTLPAENPSSSKGGSLISTTVHATGGMGTAGPDKTQAKVSKLVPTDVDGQVPHKPQKNEGGDGDAAPIAPIEPRDVRQKGQAVVIKQTSENRQYAQTGDVVAAKNGVSNAPLAAQLTPKVHSAVAPQKPDQPLPKTPSAGQDSAIEAPSKAERGLQGLQPESRPRVSSKRDGVPGVQTAKMEAVQSGGRETQPSRHRDGVDVLLAPPASSVGQPAATVAHPSVGTPVREFADIGAAENPMRNVGEQIRDSVQASVTQGDRQIVIRLQPPELGTVVVRFREQGEHLDGALEVGKSETRREIEQALPDVVRSLQDAGIPIRRLDVMASDSPEQALGKEQPQQDAWSGQQGLGQNRDHLPASHTPWSRTAANSPVDSQGPSSAESRIRTSRGQIDILL